MNLKNAPQPIPYQGSKRQQVPVILRYIPSDTATLWEPFVGSGAVTIGAAANSVGQSFVMGDSLEALAGIWDLILRNPQDLCERYEAIWNGQLENPRAYYDQVRDEFNQTKDPAKLLYLIARCVKNAVRFNSDGAFNQSPDNRRLGMRPALLRDRVQLVHKLLAQRAVVRSGDYSLALRAAGPLDVVYMDPPYMGVSGTRDSRYYQGLDYERFVAELGAANERGVSFLVSFDGRCGGRTYGPGLPEYLGLEKTEIHVGRSSQSTLNGGADETVESLYFSPALKSRITERGVRLTSSNSVKSSVARKQLSMFVG